MSSLEQRLTRLESLLESLLKRDAEKTKNLSNVFEKLDGRLSTIENGIVAAAGDASQARHNTHQIRNAMQLIVATQTLILEHLHIRADDTNTATDLPIPPPPST
jgi:hypothetical protein